MPDPRNSHLAEPFRSTLNGFAEAMSRVAPRICRAPDQSFFIVTRDFGKLGYESVTDPSATRASVIEDIASGQIDRVAYVIECNPVAGWSKDITSEINEAVAERIIRAA